MKRHKIIVSLTLVLVLVFMMGLIPVSASATSSYINRSDFVRIACTNGRAQWVCIEAAQSNIVIVMKNRYNQEVWCSAWTGEYLDRNYGGYYNYKYSHWYWCGSDVYYIYAYNLDGGKNNPIIVTYSR